jgi:elongation factor G
VFMKPDEDAPFSALAFKVMTDPHVGRLVYLRVYSGQMRAGTPVYNSTKGTRERMGRALTMHANRREETDVISAGNIAAAVGLKSTFTGDTICSEGAPVILESISFPEPVVSVAIEPKTKMDQEKLIDSLIKLSEEDPTFTVKVDDETGQTIMAGMGELHLEVLVERLRSEFQVAANIGRPRVSYRETITEHARAEGRFIRQTGGHGQFGHVWLELEPLERNGGIQFENKIRGAAIPKEFIPHVEKGVREALETGVLAGYPVIDTKISLVDGSYHPVDSSEMAFKMAGSMGVKEGVRKAKAVLLEPVMEMEILTPDEFLGEVLGDLGGRRSRIRNIEAAHNLQTVRAYVPLAETFGYITILRSLTQGRASQSMEFHHYEEVPQGVAQELVKV